MEIFREVLSDLWGMFWADRRLTVALLLLVAVAALLAKQVPGLALALIAFGPAAIICLVVLIAARSATR